MNVTYLFIQHWLVDFGLFNDAFPTSQLMWSLMLGWFVNNKLERMYKEAVVA
jgi:hypothetical protein